MLPALMNQPQMSYRQCRTGSEIRRLRLGPGIQSYSYNYIYLIVGCRVGGSFHLLEWPSTVSVSMI